jgi:uncharacterized protein
MSYLLRLLIVLVVLWIALRLLRSARRRSMADRRGSTTVPLVRCAHCGTHVPAQDALERDHRHYCSVEHLNAGPRTE